MMKNLLGFYISLGLLVASLSTQAQAQGTRIHRSSNPGVHRNIIIPNNYDRGYVNRGTSYYQPNSYPYSRETIIIDREYRRDCARCYDPAYLHPSPYYQNYRRDNYPNHYPSDRTYYYPNTYSY